MGEVRILNGQAMDDTLRLVQLGKEQRDEIERLKAENARLAAALSKIRKGVRKARAFPESIGTMDSVALVGVLSILETEANE